MTPNFIYYVQGQEHIACQDCYPDKDWVTSMIEAGMLQETGETNKSCEFCGQESKDPVHYTYGNGSYGCLYDSCGATRTYQEAVNYFAQLFELGRTRKATLKRNSRLDLNNHKDGADYCEIQECNCGDISSHQE